MGERSTGWGEDTSRTFIELGDVVTPSRREQLDLLVSLMPAEPHEEFHAVDLACGAGSLSEAVLERYPRCRVLALDPSPAMRAEAARRLTSFRDRVRLDSFDLRSRDWVEHVPHDTRCFVSSLAIHHLDAGEKRVLFQDLARLLPPGGAVLIADLVEPANSRAWRVYGDAWDGIVRDQSLQATGSLDVYLRFKNGWNHFRQPDLEFDKPSRLFDQLQWLVDAGFSDVDCFWLRAGHAIYGGYR